MELYPPIPNIPATILNKANSSIVEYHKTRHCLDFTFIKSIFEAQDRIELQIRINREPNKKHNYENRLGYVP